MANLKPLAAVLLGAGFMLGNLGSLASAQWHDEPAPCNVDPEPSCERPCVWGGAEYLLWWVKDAPLPLPLVTSNDPAVPGNSGFAALGQPGTRVLYGGNDQSMGAFSGLRLSVGAWLDNQAVLGLEAGGLWLLRRSAGFSAHGDPAGNPSIAAPFFNDGSAFNAVAGNEDAVDASRPNLFAGSITVRNTTELWGAEANALCNLHRNNCGELQLLAGYRYLNLQESLDYTLSQNGTGLLQGSPFFVVSDSFTTHNHFLGGQVGLRGLIRHGNLTADATAKIALGGTREVVVISGQGTQTPLAGQELLPGTTAQFSSGIYALPSNLGRQEQTAFTVVPEVQLKVGYDVTSWLRLTGGYSFLYWSNVVRPGEQIDHTLNRSQSLGRPLVGEARPAPLFNTTDFFAHGLNLGVELCW